MASRSPKKAAPKRAPSTSKRKPAASAGGGSQLVIVESPAKAKTIEKYLGPGFVVKASIGHIRDLPARNPKGVKAPVPGVDLENDFEPTYEISEGKAKTVAELKKLAKAAECVWFATDLDREGESIAWHLADLLGVDPLQAKRVTFDAITKDEITSAFSQPRAIDMRRVEAQQARRILDRIVGYEVSPLLWKKVAGGLSAGRVQSVATRLVVDREREIEAFRPDERWSIAVRTASPGTAASLVGEWSTFMARRDERGKGPIGREQSAWMSDHQAIECDVIDIGGDRLKIEADSHSKADLVPAAVRAAEASGMLNPRATETSDKDGVGRGTRVVTLTGEVDPAARFTVASIETSRTTKRPYPPFKTSTLQQAASSRLGFRPDRTMRVAQRLYEGVNVPGVGLVGLITYMRTDSLHLSGEALSKVRDYIGHEYGDRYLPAKPRFYDKANTKGAQEAHEAIRPTDPSRTPESLRGTLEEEQLKLYTLIWKSFVSCQMVDAEWDSTAILLKRSDRPGATLKANGRTLAFDGFYRAAGVPSGDEDQNLPPLKEGDVVAPFSVEPRQSFSAPPPRYTEATLVKKLEEEGIGRPSTYASIIGVILDRGYVESLGRSLAATDLGMVVTDLLAREFKDQFIELGYTRHVEEELDDVAAGSMGWREMLREFYDTFKPTLVRAHEHMVHTKAEMTPAPYACPTCGAHTGYRFGRNGRFLSCMQFPDCKYAAPVDRRGRPMLPERVDLLCPVDGKPMILRKGRFGEFLTSEDPGTKFILNIDKKKKIKFPSAPPVVTGRSCEKCGKPMNLRDGKRGPWLGCSGFPKCRGREAFAKLPDGERTALEAALKKHMSGQSTFTITTLDGTPVADGTPLDALRLPGGVQELALHAAATTPN